MKLKIVVEDKVVYVSSIYGHDTFKIIVDTARSFGLYLQYKVVVPTTGTHMIAVFYSGKFKGSEAEKSYNKSVRDAEDYEKHIKEKKSKA